MTHPTESARTRRTSKKPGKSLPLFDRDRLLSLLKGVLLFFLALLFARTEALLETLPLGLALLVSAERGLFPIYLGTLASTLPLFDSPLLLPEFAIYTLVLLLRVIVRMTVDLPWRREERGRIHSFSELAAALFRENLLLRMTVGALGGFLMGLYRLIAYGYRPYDLYASFFLIAAVPLLSYLFAGAYRKHFFALQTKRDLVTFLAFSASIVFSLVGERFYTVPLSVFSGFFLMLLLLYRKGIPIAILAGLLFGLVQDPFSAPLYAFAAVGAGSLKRVSSFLSALSALTIGMIWGFYIYGLSALSLLFPALFASSMLFSVLYELKLLPLLAHSDPDKNGKPVELPFTAPSLSPPKEPKEERGENRKEDSAMEAFLYRETARREHTRFDALYAAVSSLSGRLGEARREHRFPGKEDLRRCADRVYDEFCPGCPSCALCWGKEYARMSELLSTLSEIQSKGERLLPEHLPADLRKRCSLHSEILYRLNEEGGILTENRFRREKALGGNDYGIAAECFRTSVRQETPARDRDRTARAELLFRSYGLDFFGLLVSSERAKGLYALGVRPRELERLLRNESFLSEFYQKIGFLPGEPVYETRSNESTEPESGITGGKPDIADLFLPPLPRYSVSAVSLRKAATAEDGRETDDCGDHVSTFRGKDGKFYALLSDGMGSGKEAAALSQTAVEFLEKMLSSGGESGVVLRMLNTYLLSGSREEMSATIDLCEIDEITGTATFQKSGAAPTYILRDGNLFRLSAHTVPAGILPEADFQKTTFHCLPGDLILMMSDGVEEGRHREKGERHAEELYLLCGLPEDEEALLRAARAVLESGRRSGHPSDDRSVILLRVDESPRFARLGKSEKRPKAG